MHRATKKERKKQKQKRERKEKKSFILVQIISKTKKEQRTKTRKGFTSSSIECECECDSTPPCLVPLVEHVPPGCLGDVDVIVAADHAVFTRLAGKHVHVRAQDRRGEGVLWLDARREW